ncbi:Uncharacterised protein [Burkholderia pseudomallei]|nr:Uncharacterised protein [Burkholderia pseudomallei]
MLEMGRDPIFGNASISSEWMTFLSVGLGPSYALIVEPLARNCLERTSGCDTRRSFDFSLCFIGIDTRRKLFPSLVPLFACDC